MSDPRMNELLDLAVPPDLTITKALLDRLGEAASADPQGVIPFGAFMEGVALAIVQLEQLARGYTLAIDATGSPEEPNP